MKTTIIICVATALLASALTCCSAQKSVQGTQVEKLDESQLQKFITSQERPDYTFRESMFINNTDYLISKLPILSLGQLESFLDIVNSMNRENDMMLLMRDRAAASIKGGLQAAINKYSSKPDMVVQNLQERDENKRKLSLVKGMLESTIEKKKNQVFNVPQGDIVYYNERSFGGMLPPNGFILEKKDNGKTYLTVPTGFNSDTTVVAPDEALAHIKDLFIEGKAYEIAPLYLTPFRIFDAPSWSLEVRFSNGETLSSYGQQSSPNNDGLNKISEYVHTFMPKIDPRY